MGYLIRMLLILLGVFLCSNQVKAAMNPRMFQYLILNILSSNKIRFTTNFITKVITC